MFLGTPTYAQETATEDEQEPAETETAESSEDEELDETDYYEMEQDDFDPTQDVVADQSLAFPTDI